MNTIRVSNGLDLYQDRRPVGAGAGQTVCKGYQQTTIFAASKDRVRESWAFIKLFGLSHRLLPYLEYASIE